MRHRYFYVESNGMPDHPMMVGITAWQQQVPIPQTYTGRNAWQIPLFPKLSDKPVRAKKELFRGDLALAVSLVFVLAGQVSADYPGWKQSGSSFILTTPEGANLPASASVENFPLLVRLHKDFFDFNQAQPDGADLRFSTSKGEPLAYQIEEWDAKNGVASIWVRVPKITGNSRQEIKLHWGKADAKSESDGKAVFNETNGYLSVWHMAEVVKDEVGTLESKDTGTTATPGIIGTARHFADKKGIFCGDKITGYPVGATAHTTEAWFRAEKPNARAIAWGNEHGQGKVVMHYRSPPHVKMECYFSGADVSNKTPLTPNEWVHVVHTYEKGDSRIYINGRLDGESKTQSAPLAIKSPARLWIGGWYDNYDFTGDIDETRVSKVVRAADWVRLQYENQKPLQTLVGPVVQPGQEFGLPETEAALPEGKSMTFEAKAGGAQKVYWSLVRDGKETVVATDRFAYTFVAGRVVGSQTLTLRFKAVYANETKIKDIPVTIKEDIPEPAFTLQSPAEWDGRKTIEVVPQITNLDAMKAKGADKLNFTWNVSGLAVIKDTVPGKLVLTRAQNSGTMTVAVAIDNGGTPSVHSATIAVKEPATDAWVARSPAKDEKPEEGRFYARDDKNEGTLFYNGTLTEAADTVFLRCFADDKLIDTLTQKPGAGGVYAFTVKLKLGLIKYRIEFGTKTAGQEKVLDAVGNIVCGDAYLIQGQSNALATDTGEKSPPETNDWIRSYGGPSGRGDSTGWVRDRFSKNPRPNLWCNPVWKAEKGEKAELGYWGMELAKRLVASQKVPIFIINGAVGGTRIDEHQPTPANHADLKAIYGRTLWRVQQAKMTHGIRAVIWHQGESDQGADGSTGGYGWETYQQFFVELSAAWKQDFPNIQHYYVYQIWPNACSMGNGHGDMLREVQRTLPRLYSNMSIMSTHGIKPPGGCHYPLTGWAEFARLIQPLIERDHYGKVRATSITPPNLKRAYFTGDMRDTITLEFDQPVVWADTLTGQFYLDGEKDKVASGAVAGNVITLKLKASSTAKKITYLKEMSWNQDKLLIGANGIAALTFCDVPIVLSAK